MGTELSFIRFLAMKFLVFLMLVLVSASAIAENRDNIKITKINVISTERKTSVASAGVVRLYFASVPWGETTCRPGAADIIPGDDKLYTAALAAFMAGREVLISVDSTTRPVDDVCKIDAIHIK